MKRETTFPVAMCFELAKKGFVCRTDLKVGTKTHGTDFRSSPWLGKINGFPYLQWLLCWRGWKQDNSSSFKSLQLANGTDTYIYDSSLSLHHCNMHIVWTEYDQACVSTARVKPFWGEGRYTFSDIAITVGNLLTDRKRWCVVQIRITDHKECMYIFYEYYYWMLKANSSKNLARIN